MRPVLVQQLQHSIGLETLADQVSIQPLKLAVVRDRRPAAQTLGEGGVEQRIRIDRAEHLVDGAPGDGSGDSSALDLPFDAKLAAAANRGLRSRDRLRHARILERALLTK